MLLLTITSPSIFDLSAYSGTDKGLYCSLVIGVLHDLLENGIILVDEKNVVLKEISSLISTWPIKYRKKCQQLIRDLQYRNRFVQFSQADYTLKTTCNKQFCQHCIGISIVAPNSTLLTTGDCYDCACKYMPKTTVTDIASYFFSNHFRECRNNKAYILGDGEWSKSVFENKIFSPLFLHAKDIKILDRWIGRSVTPKGGGGSIDFSNNYQRTLEWIFDLFFTRTRPRNKGNVEVFCGLDTTRLSTTQKAATISAIRVFVSSP